ncbi:MAG: acetyl/propionyl/methylcrotonyl-CoA carboxylase subunit alpha [Alphaproteobacteria bacterium]|nr:acetyl/propionyl/methylcrotonyl-CoA carboxylase subunit alpha [Alphaproteobacteria bacterium]
MFSKVLIANRGEIACRIIRTAHRLGIAAVAVYSEADEGALHVELADEAWPIGPPPARESYLNIAVILEAARNSGAEAVHPGYGFLSENADFAEACEAAGLVFIGPPVSAIRSMGSKAEAKELMQRHGVPLVPGYHGGDQDSGRLLEEAERVGFPVLIKASAGGGGRGMRIVGHAGEFAAALAGARREAVAAFGDDRVLIEKYLERPRHIEIQIFADRFGNTVHLFERDCSIQRRHQKILEEAPAPGLDAAQRSAIAEAAVTAARAVGYIGAGTVEFIAEEGAFYFIEMNTRLQVEHPVTEAVTGLDLVEWQLRVAAGEPLPMCQQDLVVHGHAIEARLYAEDPQPDFLPQTGTLRGLRFPPTELARIDTGVRKGDTVTPFYDAMIAKIIAFGDDRTAAVGRLQRALAATAVFGVGTNLEFLARIVAHPEFVSGAVDTSSIDCHRAALGPPLRPAPDIVLAAAALSRLLARENAAKVAAAHSGDPFSPWDRVDGWRLNGRSHQELIFRDGAEERSVRARYQAGDWLLQLGDRAILVAGERQPDDTLAILLDGVRKQVMVMSHGAETAVFLDGERWRLSEIDPLGARGAEDQTAGRLSAPMPGRVAQVMVEPGMRVRRGQPLIVIEAMKMEHTVAASADGVVEAVRYSPGDLVEEGAELIALAPTDQALG